MPITSAYNHQFDEEPCSAKTAHSHGQQLLLPALSDFIELVPENRTGL